MRILPRSVVVTILAILSFLLSQQSAGAVSVDVIWPTLVGVVEGQVVSTQVTVSSGPSEPQYSVTVDLGTASSSATSVTTLLPGTTQTLDITLSAGDIQECADNGSLYVEVVTKFDPGSTPPEQSYTQRVACSLFVSHASTTPEPPLLTEVCGPANDYIQVPGQPVGVEVVADEDGSDGVLSVEFFPSESYEFPEGTQTFYQFTDENTPCTLITPVPQQILDVCGPNNDQLLFPEEPVGLVVIPGEWINGTMILTYLPAFGYAIAPGAQSVFPYVDHNTPCVAPIAPVQTAVCGVNNDIIDIPAQPVNVLIAGDTGWIDGSRWIAFTAAEGFGLDPAMASEFSFIDDGLPCATVDPSPSATVAATVEPTGEPTVQPTIDPTVEPTATTTVVPPAIVQPSVPPTLLPTTASLITPTPAAVAPPAVTGLPKTGSGDENGLSLLVISIQAIVLMAVGIGIARERSS